ncbi:MAG: hypothetical protein LEGION0398_MBIBDBAK_01216 [Legionellaceae bacterium]
MKTISPMLILSLIKSFLNNLFLNLLFFIFINNSALANLSFSSGTKQLGDDIMNFLSPLAGIVIIALGVGAWMGKISWAWCISFIFGLILVFGHQQVLDWLRSLFNF